MSKITWGLQRDITPRLGARLVQALQLVDIRVPDHLIVGGTQILSFAEHGLL